MARYIRQPPLRSAQASRRIVLIGVTGAIIFFILFIASFREGSQPTSVVPAHAGSGRGPLDSPGKAIAPKLGNETAKAELGRAAWKVLHTTFARFPEKPNTEEKDALRQYVHLFQRLYPCGECSDHFSLILKQYPPQVSSRNAAAAWGCHVHNEVNKSLKKEIFDCNNIGDFYDCGCADDDKKKETQPSR